MAQTRKVFLSLNQLQHYNILSQLDFFFNCLNCIPTLSAKVDCVQSIKTALFKLSRRLFQNDLSSVASYWFNRAIFKLEFKMNCYLRQLLVIRRIQFCIIRIVSTIHFRISKNIFVAHPMPFPKRFIGLASMVKQVLNYRGGTMV